MTVPLLFTASKPACLLARLLRRASRQAGMETLKIYGDWLCENCGIALVRICQTTRAAQVPGHTAGEP